MTTVPASTHDITSTWLTQALKRAGKLKSEVTDVKVETIGAGVGLMGELARLHISFAEAEDLPGTIVAKCAAQNENRLVAQVLDFYNREANFYNEVATDCPLRIPDSYYADVNQETYDFVLLMEDLGDVSPRDQLVGASEEEVISAITEAAALHSQWWDVTDKSHPWMYDMMSTEEAGRLKSLVYAPALEPAIEQFDYLLDPKLTTLLRTVGSRFEECWALGDDKTDSFLHGDYRQDNMLYSEGRPDALVMDWQICGRGKPIFDLAYFMCQSVATPLREDIEEQMLALYVGRLKDAGIDYPLEQCREDYRRIILGCLVYPVTVCGSLDLANERGRALAECMLTRNLAAIDKLGSAALL